MEAMVESLLCTHTHITHTQFCFFFFFLNKAKITLFKFTYWKKNYYCGATDKNESNWIFENIRKSVEDKTEK